MCSACGGRNDIVSLHGGSEKRGQSFHKPGIVTDGTELAFRCCFCFISVIPRTGIRKKSAEPEYWIKRKLLAPSGGVFIRDKRFSYAVVAGIKMHEVLTFIRERALRIPGKYVLWNGKVALQHDPWYGRTWMFHKQFNKPFVEQANILSLSKK